MLLAALAMASLGYLTRRVDACRFDCRRAIVFGCRVTGRGVIATIAASDSSKTTCLEADQIVGQLKLKLGQEAELRVLNGDCGKLLSTLDADSIQCCVTSPPYWGLRDYDHPDQIGAEPSPDLYVQNLVNVFAQVRRVLKDNGTLWLNVGDGYARNGGTGKCGPNAAVGNTKKLIQKRNCKVPDVWGLKDRDLMGMPWRVAFALQEDGWILRSKIAWIKKTAMPESVKNRPTNATEEIFLFAKSSSYYYDSKAVREETGANLRNYWILGPDPNNYGHPAAFPRELARRCILLGSCEQDWVLDPFGGSGTTGIVANQNGRNAILIELNTDYAASAKERGLV